MRTNLETAVLERTAVTFLGEGRLEGAIAPGSIKIVRNKIVLCLNSDRLLPEASPFKRRTIDASVVQMYH